MKLIENERISPFDVDNTLVMHVAKKEFKKHRTVKVYDSIEAKTIVLVINEPMVRLLKEEFTRGSFVIVWSRGGNQWASSVVKALGLEFYVHQVMSKPIVYFDDTPVSEWLKDRVYMSPDSVYKK